MIRIRVRNKDLGIKVEQIDLDFETEDEAKLWLASQAKTWGVDGQRLEESCEFEERKLLLDANS